MPTTAHHRRPNAPPPPTPHAPVNTRWFQDQLADRHLSQRKLAKMMDLDPSAVSLMLRGMRVISADEAAELARILGVPLQDVLAQIGVDLPRETGLDTVKIVGHVDMDGIIHAKHPGGPREAPKPPGTPDATVAVRYMSDDYRDGMLLYFTPVDYVMPEAIGRMSVVELPDGRQAVRVIKHGYEPGQFRLAGPVSGEMTMARVVSASLVTWMRT